MEEGGSIHISVSPILVEVMGKGTAYGSERRFLQDEETGVRITRLTGFPTINNHVYMHSRCFTSDSRDVIFYSQRQLMRGSQRDIFAVSIDGMNLRQITERDNVGWMTCSSTGRSVFYVSGNSIWNVDVDSYEETRVAYSPTGSSLAIVSVSKDGRRLLSFTNEGDKGSIILTDLIKETSEVVYRHPTSIGHLQLEPESSLAAMFHDRSPTSKKPRIWCINIDGSDPRMLYDNSEGHGDPSHFVWLPGGDSIISTLQSPEYGIIKIDMTGDVEVVSNEEHFWHAGASLDGRTLCSDTFQPDNGIFLVDADTGKHRKLCLSKSSNSHTQWSHPHPTWSPDGKMVLFTSDREGLPQVFLVIVPESYLE